MLRMAFRDVVGILSVLFLVVFAMVTTILAITRELNAKKLALSGNIMTSSPPTTTVTPR